MTSALDPHRKPVVLVVDDDRLMRRMIVRQVAPFGTAVAVGSYTEAVMFLAEANRPVAAAILDVVLPDGTGLGVLERLRARQPPVPTLVLTGIRDADVIAHSQFLGAEYLFKPPRPGNLQAFLQRALTASLSMGRVVADFCNGCGLSMRERQIVALVAVGVAPSELPARLGIAVGTVKSIVRRVLRKSDHRCLDDVVRVLLRACAGQRAAMAPGVILQG